MAKIVDPFAQNDRRKQWKAVKDKHAKAISAAKIDFNKNLGPALDAYQSELEKLIKTCADKPITGPMTDPFFKKSMALQPIVKAYQDSVKKIADPAAKKELGTVLDALAKDVEGAMEFGVRVVGNTQGTNMVTDVQKQAAGKVLQPLMQIVLGCGPMIERATSVKGYFDRTKRTDAAAIAANIIQTAKLVGPAAVEFTKVAELAATGKNYDLFVTRAQAFAPLLTNYRNAVETFHANFNTGSDTMTMTGVIADQGSTDGVVVFKAHDAIMQECNLILKALQSLPN